MKIELARHEHPHKGTTLQRRLVLFFISVTVLLIVAFTMLLFLFGFMGKEEKAVETFFHNELEHISGSVYEDFGLLAVDGLDYAKAVITSSEEFWRANSVSAETFAAHPELLEPLLAAQMPTILATANTHSCGGVFVLLDATVNPTGEDAATSRAGIFVKKTQPTSAQSVGVKDYYLRGPAQIARNHGVELLGQWKMEFDISGELFWNEVMETARENESLPLSRLYY